MEIRDLRLAVRSLLRHRSYSLPAILTLALGIGATTAVFSVVYAVLIRPLPYENPQALVRVYATRNGGRWTSTPPNFVDLQKQNRSFEAMAAFFSSPFALTGTGHDAEQIPATFVTSSFFDILRIRPAAGQLFGPDHEIPGRERVVLLSDGLWKRRFGSSRQIIGQTIRLDGNSWTVRGVLPPGFAYPERSEIWVPLLFTADDLQTQRGAHYLEVVARLRPDATLTAANAELLTLAEQLATAYPDKNRGWSAEAITLQESIVGKVRRPLLILLGAVSLLLLIACVNVTNLTLAQGLARRRDLAIRAAVGAGRGRLTLDLLVESVVLALVGGMAAIAVAVGAIEILTSAFPDRIPRMADVELSLPILLFGLGLSMVTGILVGILPALEISLSSDLTHRLKEGSQSAGSDRRAHQLRGVLVISEIALAVLLLVAAGLVLKSFARLLRVDPGFSTENALTFNIALPSTRYDGPHRIQDFGTRLLDDLRTIPGVERAATVFGLPLSGLSYSISLTLLDGVNVRDRDDLSTQVRITSPEYFRALGIPLRKGRSFSDSDTPSSPAVVIVNESAARKLWPDSDPIGRTFELGTRFGTGKRIGGAVVGVVGDVRHSGVAQPPQPEAYFPHRQVPSDYFTVVLETKGDPEAVTAAARAKLRALDPELPMFEVQTMEQLAADSVASPRFYATVINFFGALAVILAAIGIYGVIAFAVDRRTREIGIRMVLGARPSDVLRQVLGQGVGLTLAGLAAGMIGSVGILRLIAGMLFDTAPTDPLTYVAVASVLTLVATAATYIPARRAMRVEPMAALRYE